jgi:hypothetical protein
VLIGPGHPTPQRNTKVLEVKLDTSSATDLTSNVLELKPDLRGEKPAFCHLNIDLIWINVHYLNLASLGWSEYVVRCWVWALEKLQSSFVTSLVDVI